MLRAIAVVLVLVSFSCAPPPAAVIEPATEGPHLDMRVLRSGSHSRAATGATAPSASTMAVARDAAGFERLWRENVTDDAPPQLDFARESAVFLFLGVRRTGGYRIDLDSVAVDGSTVRVTAPVINPPPDAITTQALTAPFVVIAVSRAGLEKGEWLDANGRTVATSESRPSALPIM